MRTHLFMKNLLLACVVLVCFLPPNSPVSGQTKSTWNEGIDELSKQISAGLTENQKRTIAVVEFGDLEGHVTNFGRFVAEELITRLYQTRKFTVIERQLLNKVLAEQKLSLTGILDQGSVQKLGRLLGVDAIACGTVTDLGKSLRVNARLIDTSTAVIFAVASTEIVKDDSVKTMDPSTIGPSNTDSSVPSYAGNAIASKEIGSLRVVFKSAMRVKLKDQQGRSVNGIRCAFEFINLETQRPIVVAMNASVPDRGISIGSYLRSTLVDDNGGLWRLYNSNVAGMSIVGVGIKTAGGFSSTLYDPAEIVIALSKRDDLNSDVATSPRGLQYQFIFGSMTTMPPGQSLTVSVTFTQDVNETTTGTPPTVFQMASEIVVGVMTIGTKKSYALHNITFDRVSLSSGGI